MERIEITVGLVLLVWALFVLRTITSELKALKDEQNRHNNIQKVILEQVDEINQKVLNMKWIVRNKDGVLEFNSTVVCTHSEYNKINAGINQQKIKAWCDDNHVSIETLKEEQCMSVLKEIITEVDEREARRMDRLHEDFLRFVSHLPEVDATEACKVDEQLEKYIKFVKEVLDEWDETETRLGTCGATLLGKDSELNLVVSCGHIGDRLLKQMFEAWLDKYDK